MASYIPGKNLSVVVNAKNLTVVTSNLTEESEEIETTNVTSAGNYEGIGGIKTRSFDYEMVMDADDLETLTTGVAYPATWGVAGGHAATGNLILFSKSHRAGAKGAYTVSGRGKYTGPVTVS